MKRTREEALKDIKENPEKHRHDFENLALCSTLDGAFDSELLEAHSKYVDLGTNGGRACDTTSGPCACGAWH